MAFDLHSNFGYATIATAPTPAASGTTFSVTAGFGAIFPAAPFNAVVWPAGANPLTTNAEIVRVTNKGTGDNWTVTRTQESSSARSIAIGDQIMCAVTAKTLTDIETQVNTNVTNIAANAAAIVLAKWNVITTTSTGTQNDFAPGLSGHTEIRCNNATLLTVNGLSGGFDGQLVRLVSIGAGQVDLAHQAAGSTAANRFINFATVGNTSLAAGVGVALYQYDATTARWRLLEHEQGAWITITFAAGNYTATGGGSWTVDSGDVSTSAFYLRGRTLVFNWQVSSTSVAGTASSLNILQAAFNGYTPVKTMYGFFLYNDNGGGNTLGYTSVSAADTKIVMSKLTGNFAVATNATHTFGAITFEVT